jgi:poly(3-hydroxyalkanoate) synthetase
LKILKKMEFPISFGVFSLTGHVVMAFATDGEAERARQLLIGSGFAKEDVAHYNKDEVMAELEKSEKQSESPVQIGQEVAKVDEYLVLAKQGCGFLVLHAPKDEAAKRAVAIVKPLAVRGATLLFCVA